MAHISESKVDGVVYTYDSESRNPLGLDAKMRMWAGTLVYDKNTRAPTRILKGDIPAPTPVVTVAKPTISITSDGKVTITCATAGAVIYYTTNGSNPSDSSTEYAGQFTLADSATVKAIAYAEIDGEEKASAVASKAYTKQSTPTPQPSGNANVYLGAVYCTEAELQLLDDGDMDWNVDAVIDRVDADVVKGTAPTTVQAMNYSTTYEKSKTSIVGEYTHVEQSPIYYAQYFFAYPKSFGTYVFKNALNVEIDPITIKEVTIDGVVYNVVLGFGDNAAPFKIL